MEPDPSLVRPRQEVPCEVAQSSDPGLHALSKSCQSKCIALSQCPAAASLLDALGLP